MTRTPDTDSDLPVIDFDPEPEPTWQRRTWERIEREGATPRKPRNWPGAALNMLVDVTLGVLLAGVIGVFVIGAVLLLWGWS